MSGLTVSAFSCNSRENHSISNIYLIKTRGSFEVVKSQSQVTPGHVEVVGRLQVAVLVAQGQTDDLHAESDREGDACRQSRIKSRVIWFQDNKKKRHVLVTG